MRMRAAKVSVGLAAPLISAMLISPAVSFADSGGAHTGRAESCPDIQLVFARGTNPANRAESAVRLQGDRPVQQCGPRVLSWQ